MSRSPQILYVAAGAGMGHLVRACAVCLALRDRGLHVGIVTHSVYTELPRGVTGLTIDVIPSHRWAQDATAFTEALNPRLVVLDTFPWGLRGEWPGWHRTGRQFALVARRLNIASYLDAAGLEWDYAALRQATVIAAEPLNEDYLSLLDASGAEVHTLPGRIRFPAEAFPTPVPRALEMLLERGRLWLVVHSGPEEEVRALVDRARAGTATLDSGITAAVLPRSLEGLSCPVFSYFPAAGLYDRAYRVLTGAGYNSLAEMARWKHKHICVPFPRRYDDQEGRLLQASDQWGDGTAEAARLIASWL